MGEDPRTIEQQIEDTRERMGDTVAALSYKADVPSRMKESVSEKTHAVTGKLGVAGSNAGDGTRRAVGMAQDNPLGLVIGAAALGFVVGSLLPETRMEEERIGPVASQVREQVSDVASDAIEHGKQVAQDAAEAAKSSGQEHAQQLRDEAQETMRS